VGGLSHGLVGTSPDWLVPAFDASTNPLIGDSLDGISGAAMEGGSKEAAEVPPAPVDGTAELALGELALGELVLGELALGELALGELGSTFEEAMEVAGSPGGAISGAIRGAIRGEVADAARGSEEAGGAAVDSLDPVSSFACWGSEDVRWLSPPGMAGSVAWLDVAAAEVLRKPGRFAG